MKHWVGRIFCCQNDVPVVQAVCDELFDTTVLRDQMFRRGIIYSLRPAAVGNALDRWCDIQEGMQHASRFFNDSARELFSWLFDGLDQYPGSPEKSAVVKILSPEDCPPIYRARTCSTPVMDEICRDPSKSLGAPPKEISREGRMSPAGIPAFYGAFDRETCLAELRPPVGGTVISGEFRLNSEVRVLDFQRFENDDLGPIPSFFDPEYFDRVDRQVFLRKIHEEITLPVLPGAGKDYLITQIIAEYLAMRCKPRFDGVIFRSAQRPEGRNIVLFSHVACRQTSSTVRIAGGYRVNGARESDAPRIQYVAGSLIHHTIYGLKVNTKDEMLSEDKTSDTQEP